MPSGASIPLGRLVGISSAEAAARLRASGRRPSRPRIDRRLRQLARSSLTAPLVLLLVAVAAIYALLGAFTDAAVILAVIAVVVGVETLTAWRARRAIASLSSLAAPKARVWRDRRLSELPANELVRDDLIELSAGSRVPADARLVEAVDLLVDESLITGESQPVAREPGEGEVGQLRAGTHVLRGRATAVVTVTGAGSTLGQVEGLVAEAEPQKTPLQRQMAELARGLLIAAVVASVVVPAIGLIRGQSLRDMLLTGLTLAFATIPEELPVLLVAVLGLGSLALVRRGAIVRRLSAAETLGATTLICTDKTGTLTESRTTLTSVMTADQVVSSRPADAGQIARVRQLARSASAPSLPDAADLADPLDEAVLRATTVDWPEPMARFGFDSSRRLASGLVEIDTGLLLAVKGAPEAVLIRSPWWRSQTGEVEPIGSDLRTQIVAAASRLTAGGARVLAVASRVMESSALRGGPSQLERQLTFEGLLAFSDPLRADVPEAMRELLLAGVAVTMVTGDQPSTAASVAREAGLGGPTFIAAQTKTWTDEELAEQAARGCVVARARPEDKLRIVRAAAAAGQVVAVTGDGVNDAPALEAAAIGVAMGRGGSDVAREAADLVLGDDSFATLARAAGEGRRLYENLRKAVRYYLAVKLALIAVTLAMAVSGRPLPFSPVQIVVLEVFMDLGASLAFVNQPPESDLMRRRPRHPMTRLLDEAMLSGILAGGLTLAIVTGAVYLIGLSSLGPAGARTLALATWLVGHAALAIVMGWERRPFTLADLGANPALLAWAASAAAFAVLVLAWPPLGWLLHAGPVPAPAGALAMLAGLVAPLWIEAARRYRTAARP